jgi:hypothetical protein
MLCTPDVFDWSWAGAHAITDSSYCLITRHTSDPTAPSQRITPQALLRYSNRQMIRALCALGCTQRHNTVGHGLMSVALVDSRVIKSFVAVLRLSARRCMGAS